MWNPHINRNYSEKQHYFFFIKICEAVDPDLYHEDFVLIIYHVKLDRSHQNRCGSHWVKLMVCSMCRGGQVEPREFKDSRKGRAQREVALCSVILLAWCRASLKIRTLLISLTVESWARLEWGPQTGCQGS